MGVEGSGRASEGAADRLAALFGIDLLYPPIFYRSSIGLRFDLGGEQGGDDEVIPRLLRALDRARSIGRAAFGDRSVTAVIAAEDWGGRGSGRGLLKALTPAGIDPRRFSPVSYATIPDAGIDINGDPVRTYWFMCDEVAPDDWSKLLWLAVSRDMPVRPKAKLTIFIADPERGVLMYAYDDRGLDLVATARETLRPIGRAFESWLFDHDRERMRSVLGEI